MNNFTPAYDLLIVFGASTVSVLLFSSIRQPAIAGFIIAGAVVGPHGFRLIADTERVSVLAELGVVMLLFALGSEFPLAQIRRLRRAFFGLGAAQCITTLILGMIALLCTGTPATTALVGGAILSLSSTALVLKLLTDRRETRSLPGQLMIAVLLFQDLWVVPIMAFLPLLAAFHSGTEAATAIAIPIIRGLLILSVALIGIRFIIKGLLALVARSRVRELFLMTVFSIGVGIALLTAALGLSLALGAFLAGAILSDSRFRHQAVADIIPLRDTFLAIFFVSIGMFLDPAFIATNWLNLLLIVGGAIVIKFLATAVPASLLGYSSRIAALVGLSLSQIGEFSLVVAQEAQQLGLLSHSDVQIVLGCSFILFLITPWMFHTAPRLAPGLAGLDPLQRLQRAPRSVSSTNPPDTRPRELQLSDTQASGGRINHVVLIGYGHNGEILARALNRLAIPFVALDLNPENVAQALREGMPVEFGDGTRPEVLEAVSIETARVVVVTVSDARATEQIIHAVRNVRPDIHIIARANYWRELDALLATNPSEVVISELEAGIEIVGRVLLHYGLDSATVRSEMELLQSNDYRSLRDYREETLLPTSSILGKWVEELAQLPVEVRSGTTGEGITIRDLGLPQQTGAIIAALFRKGTGYATPDAAMTLRAGDVLFLVGSPEGVKKGAEILRSPRIS